MHHVILNGLELSRGYIAGERFSTKYPLGGDSGAVSKTYASLVAGFFGKFLLPKAPMSALNPSVKLVRSANLPSPNKYVLMMKDDFRDWVYDEERAPLQKGKWRDSLGLAQDQALDLEIGTGNGFFFAEYCSKNPERNLLGMELKFKPLIQTIKRSRALENQNGWAVRYHASLIDELFEVGELNNVFIYFPDPWPKKKHFKNRLITLEFLHNLFERQRPGSFLEIKTDHPGYFDWIMERLPKSPYQVTRETRDLHSSEWAIENYSTHFERLWTSKGLKTHMVRALRN